MSSDATTCSLPPLGAGAVTPAGGARRPLWIIGLNPGSHDAACALLRNGELIAFAEEERFRRRKRAPWEPPTQSLQWCLAFAGIELGDVACVALGSDHDALAAWLGTTEEATKVRWLSSPKRLLPTAEFGTDVPTVRTFRHHLSHAASAFWPSGFVDAAVVVVDAKGEDSSALLARGSTRGIEPLESFGIETSLGYFFEAASTYAGLGRDDAGKLMGLAAYGQNVDPMPLRFGKHGPEYPNLDSGNGGYVGRHGIEKRRAQLADYFTVNCFPHSVGHPTDIMAHANFAASAQSALEEAMFGFAIRARDLARSSRLVLAGGVALNCAANGRLADSGLFEDVYIQPAAHDAGVALGAALLAHLEISDLSPRCHMRHAYLGAGESEAEVEAALASAQVRYRRLGPDELLSTVARRLSEGSTVAWHQGRSEVGPRALGARSLLGDPRVRSTLVRLNDIKRREMWRPLAPSVLCDRFDEYFDGTPDPFMLKAANVLPAMRHRIPACTHVDGTARPQAVDPSTSPMFAALLREVESVTGVPIVVNTSLNRDGEPIANHAKDTVAIWRTTAIDLAVIGPFLLEDK